MIKRKVVQVPGREIGMTVPMAPAAATPVECEQTVCEPAITGLYWFAAGEYATTEQTAVIDADNAALAVAKIVGETCDAEVVWSAIWEDSEAGESGPPVVTPDGQALVVAADPETIAGTLTVSATIDGATHGPITLTLSAASGGGSCALNWTALSSLATVDDKSGWLTWADPILVNAGETFALVKFQVTGETCLPGYVRVSSNHDIDILNIHIDLGDDSPSSFVSMPMQAGQTLIFGTTYPINKIDVSYTNEELDASELSVDLATP